MGVIMTGRNCFAVFALVAILVQCQPSTALKCLLCSPDYKCDPATKDAELGKGPQDCAAADETFCVYRSTGADFVVGCAKAAEPCSMKDPKVCTCKDADGCNKDDKCGDCAAGAAPPGGPTPPDSPSPDSPAAPSSVSQLVASISVLALSAILTVSYTSSPQHF